MLPCKAAPDKSPHYIRRILEHGSLDATTDLKMVDTFWGHFPDASIGVRLEGIAVVDIESVEGHNVDGYAALGGLEAKHGSLPRTRTHGTASGGEHRLYKVPEGVQLTNRTGKDAIAPGVELKVNGYVLVPPSPGYTVKDDAPMEELPAWLIELAKKEEKESLSRPRERTTRAGVLNEGPIPEGQRNQTLFFWALDRKDEGRPRQEVLDLTLTENDARCTPPLPRGEVEGVVKSAMRYPLRCGTPSPELIEACDRLEEDWWKRNWKGRGGGGQTDRDVKRALIELARRYGRLLPDGSVEVSSAVRDVALAAATSYVTVSRSATKRLAQSGQIVKLDNERTRTQAATWRLLPPLVDSANTQQGASSSRYTMLCVSTIRPIGKRVWELETPAFRSRSHVGKGAAGVLYLIEASPLTVLENSDIADHLGISVSELLRRGYLKRLLDNKLVEEVREGAYGLPGAYAEKIEEVRRTPYSTTQKRKVWRKERTHPERRAYWVCEVREVGSYASEVERDERQHWQDERDREVWRRLAQAPPPESDPNVVALLQAWADERSSWWEAA